LKNSKDIATSVINYIKRNPSVTKKEVCHVLRITPDQFQAATPYIKTQCERIKTEWYVKKFDL
jgi:hypothetical protein